MKPVELSNTIPKIIVTCHKTGKKYVGYYGEMPQTTYCRESDPQPEIIRCLFTYDSGDWGLPNKPRLYRIDEDDDIEVVKNE